MKRFRLFFLILYIAFFIPSFASSEEKYVFERMWPTLQQPWYFNPSGMVFDNDDNVYISDPAFHCIWKLTSNGNLITQWGRIGTGDGQFLTPGSMAIGPDGSVFVFDYTDIGIELSARIQKFSPNGEFIKKWGSYGVDDGQFRRWDMISADAAGYVYVLDGENNRIQKFTAEGQFITKWGGGGSEAGKFNRPVSMALDNQGYIYVADRFNNRIQKFTTEGLFIVLWGEYGTGPGEFDEPGQILLDASANVYVRDNGNHRIQKFTSDGIFVAEFGGFGSGDGQFDRPAGIAMDESGSIYVCDYGNHKVQKFSSDGSFIRSWGVYGIGDGQFIWPSVIEVRNGFVYVKDSKDRIQKFTSNGRFLSSWSSLGQGDGQFSDPNQVTLDHSGNIYVSEYGSKRIQKFSHEGQFIIQWGGEGTGEGKFSSPMGIAIDNDYNVYVVDHLNDRIQKFDSNGNFLFQWGGSGEATLWDPMNGKFYFPYDITIDEWGKIYVSDLLNNRIQIFTADGAFLSKWNISAPTGIASDQNGSIYVISGGLANKFSLEGSLLSSWGDTGSDNLFESPWDIAVDGEGCAYVGFGGYNNPYQRIQKFTSDGDFITEFGSRGAGPGQVQYPASIAVDSNTGEVFVVDRGNNRIQVFKKVTLESNSKAIIIAGGGPYAGNNLWDATQISANFAYRTLTYQGFAKESIWYLSSDTDLDLDSNGEADDVDEDATNANLQKAITNWAADAGNLVIYLVDHGGDGTFRMSGTETLLAADLDSWLDQLQQTMPGKVTVIYDACESGSFISQLTPPSGKERVVITSTSPSEQAYFVTQGSVSFSNYFWTHIFNGVNVKDAFDLSKSALSSTTPYQHPLLDANGNGSANETEDYTLTQSFYIGNGTTIYGESPVIGSVSDAQTINGTNSAPLFADGVTDNDGIARVWVVIRPPDYNQGDSSNPVNDLPSVDLMPVGEDRFEAIYNGFNVEGTYQIAIYGRDRIGNTSIPALTTVSVSNPLRRRAIIAIGGSQSDPIWPAIENLGKQAYESLIFQGYSDNDIYFMSPVTFSAGVDGSTTLSNLNYAITTWSFSSTQDVVIYLVGEGGSGTFELSTTETLTATTLDSWIDNLQNNITGKVTVVYDAPKSGSFLPLLTPPADKKRILISSTAGDGPAHFLSEGDISFSKFFWRRILDGMNVRDAFINAKNAIRYFQSQVPQLDDNSNGIGNEKIDGIVARDYSIGVGIMLAGDDPLIGSVSPEETLNGTTSATIWAQDVTTTGTIEKVWAVITPPDYGYTSETPVIDMPNMELIYNSSSERYEGVYSDFLFCGIYNITIYAMDTKGNISIPSGTNVIQANGLSSKGDLNGSCAVDLSDLIVSLQLLAGFEPAEINPESDVNGDGKIGLEESLFIIQKISELR